MVVVARWPISTQIARGLGGQGMRGGGGLVCAVMKPARYDWYSADCERGKGGRVGWHSSRGGLVVHPRLRPAYWRSWNVVLRNERPTYKCITCLLCLALAKKKSRLGTVIKQGRKITENPSHKPAPPAALSRLPILKLCSNFFECFLGLMIFPTYIPRYPVFPEISHLVKFTKISFRALPTLSRRNLCKRGGGEIDLTFILWISYATNHECQAHISVSFPYLSLPFAISNAAP
jgi:hypothetical protein